jgi:hypothetical protein
MVGTCVGSPRHTFAVLISENTKFQKMISPDTHGEFASAIRRAVERFKPTKVIETGTYLGDGTTRVLYESLKASGEDFTLVTIEANRSHFQVAEMKLRDYPEVVCLHGLSIPRDRLPSPEQIKRFCVDEEVPGIYYDHPANQRVRLYLEEQNTNGTEKLLWVAAGAFGFKPDLVLLDSAGHLGWIEFQYLESIVKSPYVLVCDDRKHVKHWHTYNHILDDPAWEMIEIGDERFGFFVARKIK